MLTWRCSIIPASAQIYLTKFDWIRVAASVLPAHHLSWFRRLRRLPRFKSSSRSSAGSSSCRSPSARRIPSLPPSERYCLPPRQNKIDSPDQFRPCAAFRFARPGALPPGRSGPIRFRCPSNQSKNHRFEAGIPDLMARQNHDSPEQQGPSRVQIRDRYKVLPRGPIIGYQTIFGELKIHNRNIQVKMSKKIIN